MNYILFLLKNNSTKFHNSIFLDRYKIFNEDIRMSIYVYLAHNATTYVVLM